MGVEWIATTSTHSLRYFYHTVPPPYLYHTQANEAARSPAMRVPDPGKWKSVNLPVEVVERVDKYRKANNAGLRSRDAVVKAALKAFLDREEAQGYGEAHHVSPRPEQASLRAHLLKEQTLCEACNGRMISTPDFSHMVHQAVKEELGWMLEEKQQKRQKRSGTAKAAAQAKRERA